MRAVLGVDGGNTKTDYFVHSMDGHLLGHLRAGTCSHETLGMDGARLEMQARLSAVLYKAGVAQEDICAAAFGLAGVDQHIQQQALLSVVHGLGYENSTVMNDSFLGIKAGSESGIGLSSINGTGSAAGGIDAQGKWVQIGGLGCGVSGDKAGGRYIAECAIGAVYGEIYQFGEETMLTPGLLSLFDCQPEDFHTQMSEQYQATRRITALNVMDVLFPACDAGDPVAMKIVQHVGHSLAASAAGCAMRLAFDDSIPVVLIGSVWTKRKHPLMIDAFEKHFASLTGKTPHIIVLDVPPAAGSVLWALELALGELPSPEVRTAVLSDTRQMIAGL